ncbi:MAG TPA: hypothetical protein VER11_33145 [Polyangiaceae bacterium]|nr:hypothetical protein [Polyangiaceae bacterium]
MPFHWDQVAARSSQRLGASLVLVSSLFGCEQREVPSELRVEVPAVIASKDLVAVSVQATNAQGVRKLVTDGADYALEPAGLGSVSKAGMLKCERSGDGKVTVSIASVSRSVAVKCRVVDRIEAPNLGRVELAAGPFQPKVRVLDKSGTELTDVDVTFFSKNSGVAFPKDGQLVPKSVGTANLVARAGAASADFKVDVVRKVVVEALPIEQNKKLYFSLEPAKYELKIKLPSPHRMSAEWRGAPFCNATSEGLEHTWVCGLRAKAGGVAFDNPAYLKDGSKTPSLEGVELYEVP